MIDSRLTSKFKVLDGDNNSIIIKDKTSGNEYEITVREITE